MIGITIKRTKDNIDNNLRLLRDIKAISQEQYKKICDFINEEMIDDYEQTQKTIEKIQKREPAKLKIPDFAKLRKDE